MHNHHFQHIWVDYRKGWEIFYSSDSQEKVLGDTAICHNMTQTPKQPI